MCENRAARPRSEGKAGAHGPAPAPAATPMVAAVVDEQRAGKGAAEPPRERGELVLRVSGVPGVAWRLHLHVIVQAAAAAGAGSWIPLSGYADGARPPAALTVAWRDEYAASDVLREDVVSAILEAVYFCSEDSGHTAQMPVAAQVLARCRARPRVLVALMLGDIVRELKANGTLVDAERGVRDPVGDAVKHGVVGEDEDVALRGSERRMALRAVHSAIDALTRVLESYNPKAGEGDGDGAKWPARRQRLAIMEDVDEAIRVAEAERRRAEKESRVSREQLEKAQEKVDRLSRLVELKAAENLDLMDKLANRAQIRQRSKAAAVARRKGIERR